MKYYTDGYLDIELFGVDAVNRCIKCPHCKTSTNEEGNINKRCIVNGDEWDFEKALEFESEELECWL